MEVLPLRAIIDLQTDDLPPGLVGLVTGVWRSMSHQRPTFSKSLSSEVGPDDARDELLCISSAAFCNYVYDPEFNRHEDPPRDYSDLGEFFSNYGPYQSIEYYTGWQVQELNQLPTEQFWKLVRYELSHERPVVTIAPDGLTPLLLVAYEGEPKHQVVIASNGMRYEVKPEGFQHTETFKNWLVFVRPGEPPEWAASFHRQRVDVLRWVATHARNTKEFFQETCENYSPGLRGMATFQQFLEERVPNGTVPAVEGVGEYMRRHLDGLRLSRQAIARRLPVWADALDEVLDEGVGEPLRRAAEHYARALEALDAQGALRERYARALEHEEQAIAALEDAIPRFPNAFASF